MKTKYTQKEIGRIIDRQLKAHSFLNNITGLNILLRFNNKAGEVYAVCLNVYTKQNKDKTGYIAYNKNCYDIIKVKKGNYDNHKLIKTYVNFTKPIPFIKAQIKKDNLKFKAKNTQEG